MMPVTTSFSRLELVPYVTEAFFPLRKREIRSHACVDVTAFLGFDIPNRMISTTEAEATSFGLVFVSKSCSIGGPFTRCLIEVAKLLNWSDLMKA